ncbi:hypothetical protein PF011_g11337 [Phytophthora fragariae]|uniref:Uncharacterized protein n=1 Tax=Phytophthora fragariae TaxID=53985 RepID=A0A6A3KT86_9STRA|nr:hypothetical protein PF011_g11337 [Phytophthora fragariae]
MDMRSKAYPALPEGRGLRLVLPRQGDLRFRPQIPAVFAQRLYIHADPRRRFWYARFELKRKFIVMSTRGDLYAKSCVATFTMADLPKKNVLSMPRVARGDLVKVLDLVQCSRSEGQQWELVFTRWRNGMETWLPLEVVQLYGANLLQEFYVNSINSWAFHSRVQPERNLTLFRTEVELWLFHKEFQKFYERLRETRAGGGTEKHPQQRAVQTSDQVRVKPENTAPSADSAHTRPTVQGQATIAAVHSDPSEAVIREFEQRRLARERHEQLERQRRNQAVALQQADTQQRLRRDQEELRLRVQLEEQERERRIQHERQRQRAHEALHQKQKEYQQRLKLQQEREKLAEIQRQVQEKRQRAQEQEQLRQRLQQDKPTKQTPVSRRRQDAKTRVHLRTEPSNQEQQKSARSKSTKARNSSSIWSKDGDDEYVPPEVSESENSDASADSDVSADSEASDESLRTHRTQRRRRKRLLYSQVQGDDEEDDDLPDLSQPPPSVRRRNTPEDSSEDDAPIRNPARPSKRRKRLPQPDLPDGNGGTSSNIEVDLTQLSDDDEEDDFVEVSTATPVVTQENPGDEAGDGLTSDVEVETIDDDVGVDVDDDMDFEPLTIIGDIRCRRVTTRSSHICVMWGSSMWTKQ